MKEEIEIDLNLWTVPNVCTVIKGVDYKGGKSVSQHLSNSLKLNEAKKN